MRVLLRQTGTGLFYQADGRFQDSRHEALVFTNGAAAIALACQRKLSHVEVFMDFNDSNYDLAVPLLDWLE